MFIGTCEESAPETSLDRALPDSTALPSADLSVCPAAAHPTAALPAATRTAGSVFYHQLLRHGDAAALREPATALLDGQIAQLDTQACKLPPSVHDLRAWMVKTAGDATAAFSVYLEQRKAGAPRRYFSSRSHALHFLRCAAPTKLVDGAWLFGLACHWRNPRLLNLVQTYLEELGEGAPDKNHVLIYRQLLTRNGIDPLEHLDDEFFTQGLIQLALGHNAERYLPEIIGFNLGYEQLPLHLLITAYELNELGLDPYYFTLHITVDNADTGHANRAVQAVLDNLPTFGDAGDFWRRVRLGCQLAEAGVGTCDVIQSFDLEREILRIFSRKSAAGHRAHSDFCRIAGRSINDWLASADQMPALLGELKKTGWIKLGEPVENSRFWGLLQGPRAEMFGVFSAYELQLIHDWIRGEASADGRAYDPMVASGDKGRPRSFRVATRLASPYHPPAQGECTASGLLDTDMQAMQQALLKLDDSGQEKLLLAAMSPARHWTPAGLCATRMFCRNQM